MAVSMTHLKSSKQLQSPAVFSDEDRMKCYELLQALVDAADEVLHRCSTQQSADLQDKQQAVVENWETLRAKVDQRREDLEHACKIQRFLAQ
eukprot:g37564.t1